MTTLTQDDQDQIAQSDLLLVQWEIPLSAVRVAVDVAARHRVPILMNPAPVPTEMSPQTALAAFSHNVYCLTPNQNELAALTGTDASSLDSCLLAARKLARKVPVVIATLGEDGAFLVSEHEEHHVTLLSSKVRDTTGAGDVFNGVLAVGLARKEPLSEAVRIAVIAASLSVAKPKAFNAIPYEREVEEFYSKIYSG